MPKPFSIAFDLPFEEAIAIAKSKGVVLPHVYYEELPAHLRRRAFTVSGLASIKQIAAIKKKLDDIIASGGTLADFQTWAKDADLGLMPRHAETIFRNAVQGAYNAGQWRSFEANKRFRPYLMFDAINDHRTRKNHAACSGVIRRVDDPFWDTHTPMMGHNCRCTLISLNERQAQARSQGDNGLNKKETPEMAADGPGWGLRPTEWREAEAAMERAALDEIGSRVLRSAAARRLRWANGG